MKKIRLKNYRKFVYSLRFGIELESEFPEKVDIDLLRTRYRKLLNSWTVVTDASMNNGLEFKPADKNRLYFDKESFAEISEVLHIIRKHKGEVDGKKCGLHIHIDAKRMSNEEILKIIKETMAKQKFLIRDFKVSKERLEQYCRPLTKKSMKGVNVDSLKEFREGTYSNVPMFSDKYFLLNVSAYAEHKTLEFRLFNGTKNLRDIKKILKYLYEFLINALERE